MVKNTKIFNLKAAVVMAAAVVSIVSLTIYFTTMKKKSESEMVKIQVQMFEGPESDAMIPTVKYWNEHYADATGVLVETVALDRVGYFDKLELQLLSGQGVPDIIHPYSLHLGKIRESLHPMDAWLADDEIMTAPNGEKLSLDVVLPIAMETVKSPDDKIYMIPKDMSEVLLYYRADLMATPPETWDEFTALALEYTRGVNPGSPTRYGAAMQGKYEMWTFCAALENLWPHGVDVFGPLTREDERAIARGLRVFETLAEAGALPPGAVNAEHPEVAAIIKRGDVAMAIQWSAFYQELRGKEPSPGVCDKFEVAPPPGVRGADGVVDRFIYTQTINLALNKHSPRKREAMKFLAWAALGEGAVIYAKAGGSSPVKAVWERDGISDLYPRILPWVERYGRAAPTHPRLTEMMMIGSSWVQRVIAREETAARAAAGLAADARKARAASGEGTK